jgi:hypothetical protein
MPIRSGSVFKRFRVVWLCVLMLCIGGTTGVLASNGLEKITANLNKNIKFVLDNKKWQLKDQSGKQDFPISYNNTTYIPVRAVSEALGVPIEWDGDTKTIYINSELPVKPDSTTLDQLKTADDIMQYLVIKHYGNPVKTPLGDYRFGFIVTENTSKFNPYDILIEMTYDYRTLSTAIWEAENSIKKEEQAKAVETKKIFRDFIEGYAKDVISKTTDLKLRGETDASYYVYPNIQMDLVVSYKNVWVNYDFIDPNSYFASHESPLAEYGDTILGDFLWIGDYSY